MINHGHPYSDAIVDIAIAGRQSSSSGGSSNGSSTRKNVSFWSLVRDNENYRWYLMSYLVTHAGEWFTYVASISAIERIQQHSTNNNNNNNNATTKSRTSISILVLSRLLPNALFTSVGGVLADSYDRRTIMLTLDILGTFIALLFLAAYQLESIPALYVATALQMTVAAIYEPSRSSMVSMLVADGESLKKAITMSELAWSLMTSVGSSMGGFAAEYLGISTCFCMDSLSYFVSALFVWRIRGEYNAAVESSLSSELLGSDNKNINSNSSSNNNNNNDAITATSCIIEDVHNDDTAKSSSFFSLSQFTRMTNEGYRYLRTKPWGPFVFLKFCAALIYGAADVLNVSFSEQSKGNNNALVDDDDYDGANIMEGSSQRLGLLFGFVGIGCFLGPIIVDRFTDMDRVTSLERACVGSFLLMAIGCYGLSLSSSPFDEHGDHRNFFWVCAFTSVRSAGSSVVWVQSSLILQKFSDASMLGRVMSVDYALATLGEAFSAMCGGLLQDDAGLSAEEVSFWMAGVAFGTLVVWAVYLHVVRV